MDEETPFPVLYIYGMNEKAGDKQVGDGLWVSSLYHRRQLWPG